MTIHSYLRILLGLALLFLSLIWLNLIDIHTVKPFIVVRLSLVYSLVFLISCFIEKRLAFDAHFTLIYFLPVVLGSFFNAPSIVDLSLAIVIYCCLLPVLHKLASKLNLLATHQVKTNETP